MWELDHKEGWALKNWCLWTVVPEKILESPLDSKQSKPVNPKGNKSWLFIGRNDAKADAGKIEGRSRRQWQKIRWLDGLPDSMDLSLSKTPGDSGGQGSVMQSMGSQRIRHDLVTEQQPSYWSLLSLLCELNKYFLNQPFKALEHQSVSHCLLLFPLLNTGLQTALRCKDRALCSSQA